MDIARSLSLFLVAGLCEIGGGYLVWISIRDGKPAWFGIFGGVALALYGVIATLQPASFGRVYAAYGGIFIAMALAWGWFVDDVRPDRFDLFGAGLALAGVLVIITRQDHDSPQKPSHTHEPASCSTSCRRRVVRTRSRSSPRLDYL